MRYMLIVFAAAFCSLLVNPSKAQTAATDNTLSRSITSHPIPKGPSVFGIFQGRSPCSGIARQLQLSTAADCEKLKWSLTLYRDPVTFQPTTYSITIVGGGDMVKLEGSSYLQKRLEGRWAILKGIQSNPDAEIYQLELAKPKTYFYLLKGDKNVLFVLDENKEPRVGNEDFSYTLNRVELVPMNK